MPGIQDLYVDHAERHITRHEKSNTTSRISRKRVELEILQGLDEVALPIEYKMSWYHAILSSHLFDSLWLATSRRHSLPPSCTARYTPSASLQEYEAPSSYSGSDASLSSPRLPFQTPDHARAHEASFTIPGSGYHADNDSEIDPAEVAFAERVGGAAAPTTANQGFSLLDANGLLRQEGDDGAYGSPIRKPKRGSGKKSRGSGGTARGAGGMRKSTQARMPKKGVKFANSDVAAELDMGIGPRNAIAGMGEGSGRKRMLTFKAKVLAEKKVVPGV